MKPFDEGLIAMSDWMLLQDAQEGDVFETRETKRRAVVLAQAAASVLVKLPDKRKPTHWAQQTVGRVIQLTAAEKERVMTKSEKNGMSGARGLVRQAYALLLKVENGALKGADAEKATAQVKALLTRSLAIIDEGVSLPKTIEKEAKAEVAAKIEKKTEKAEKKPARKLAKNAKKSSKGSAPGAVLDRIMPRKKLAKKSSKKVARK